MSYTAVLWVLVVLVVLVAAGFFFFVLPIIKRIDNNLNVIANNDSLLAGGLSALTLEVGSISSTVLKNKDHLENLKQEVCGLRGEMNQKANEAGVG